MSSNDKNIEERIDKIERVIYGSGVTNGLIYNIASIQQQLKATDQRISELQHEVQMLNEMLNNEIKVLNDRIIEYNKRIAQLDNMLLKLIALSAGISAAISLIAGVAVSTFLHI